jgi:hypothetical protein
VIGSGVSLNPRADMYIIKGYGMVVIYGNIMDRQRAYESAGNTPKAAALLPERFTAS